MPLDTYYEVTNPVETIDVNRWDVWDPEVATRFRTTGMWTQLMTFIDLLAAPDKYSYLGTEILPGHVNHNAIPWRQLYIDSMSFDSRKRMMTGAQRYGNKVQLMEQDALMNMWTTGKISEKQFLLAVAKQQLAYSVVQTTELLSRDWHIKYALHKFYGPHGEYADFSGIQRAEADTFKIDILPQTKLRLSVRAGYTLQQYGDYANPIPGQSGQILVMTTPGVIHDIWNQRNDFMVDLRTLQDPRILNGQAISYQGFTFVDAGWENTVLWNAGNVDKQVCVLEFLTSVDATIPAVRNATGLMSGDGSPHPSNPIDGYMSTGQEDTRAIHYIQLSDFDDGDFLPGDFVTIHTQQCLSSGTLGMDYWGIDYGVNFTDGESVVVEVYTVDHTNNRITTRSPIGYDFKTRIADDASGLTLNDGGDGSATYSPTETLAAYAYLTKAQHIHPVIISLGRGAHRFNIERKVMMHAPPSIDDFESVRRVSWDMFGSGQVWNPDLYEIYFTAATFANRAEVSY